MTPMSLSLHCWAGGLLYVGSIDVGVLCAGTGTMHPL